jgi:hypothetical protein
MKEWKIETTTHRQDKRRENLRIMINHKRIWGYDVIGGPLVKRT